MAAMYMLCFIVSLFWFGISEPCNCAFLNVKVYACDGFKPGHWPDN